MNRLLLEQNVHCLRDELLSVGKDVLCLGMSIPSSKAVYVKPYYLVGIQDGPSQVHFLETHSYKTDRSMAGSAIRVRHSLCHPKGDKRKRLGRLFGLATLQ